MLTVPVLSRLMASPGQKKLPQPAEGSTFDVLDI